MWPLGLLFSFVIMNYKKKKKTHPIKRNCERMASGSLSQKYAEHLELEKNIPYAAKTRIFPNLIYSK
jgi:hypothetical protein